MSVTFKYGGNKPPIEICGLTTMKMSPPTLFANLTEDCKPIATKWRKYSRHTDRHFISGEVRRLLAEAIHRGVLRLWLSGVEIIRNV